MTTNNTHGLGLRLLLGIVLSSVITERLAYGQPVAPVLYTLSIHNRGMDGWSNYQEYVSDPLNFAGVRGAGSSRIDLGRGSGRISGKSDINFSLANGELTVNWEMTHRIAAGDFAIIWNGVETVVGIKIWAPKGDLVEVKMDHPSYALGTSGSGLAFRQGFPPGDLRKIDTNGRAAMESLLYQGIEYGQLWDLWVDAETQFTANSLWGFVGNTPGTASALIADLTIKAENLSRPPRKCHDRPMLTVGLQWGLDVPVEQRWHPDATGQGVVVDYVPGSTAAADVPQPIREETLAAVQKMFSDAGVQNLTFSNNPQDNVDIQVFFPDADAFVHAGYAFEIKGLPSKGGIPGGKAFVGVNGDVEDMAETIAHEVGHTLRLPHVKSNQNEIMASSKHDSSREVFGHFPLEVVYGRDHVEPGVTHNPLYYLRHFIDGVCRDELIVRGIEPGSLDDGPAPLPTRAVSFKPAATPDLTLYDVRVLTEDAHGDAFGAARLLATFEDISLASLLSRSFRVSPGEPFIILASSAAGLVSDIVLATGDPWVLENKIIDLKLGGNELFLQRIESAPGSFSTIARLDVNVRNVPEPATLLLGMLALTALRWSFADPVRSAIAS